MALDAKLVAVNEACGPAKAAVVTLKILSAAGLNKVGGVADPHADTVAAIKTAAIAAKAEWETARDALDAAFLV